MGKLESSLGFSFPHVKPLVSVFFKHLPAEKLAEEIFNAQGDSRAFIENLINEHYDVFRHVTRVVYYGFMGTRARRVYGNQLNIDLEDYVNTACLCVFDKLPDKLRLTSTPGEIVTCICLWLEQKVKRAICGEIDNEYCIRDIPESESEIQNSSLTDLMEAEAVNEFSTNEDEELESGSSLTDLMEAEAVNEFSTNEDEELESGSKSPVADSDDAENIGAYTKQYRRAAMRVHSSSEEDVLTVIERLQHTVMSNTKDTHIDFNETHRRGESAKSYLQSGKTKKIRCMRKATAAVA